MKEILRVYGYNSIPDDYCLVHKSNIGEILSQYKNCKEIKVIKHSGELVLKMENGIIKDCIDSELLDLYKSDSYVPIGIFLFEVLVKILDLERYFIFSSNLEQAYKDFSEWCIFEPIQINNVS